MLAQGQATGTAETRVCGSPDNKDGLLGGDALALDRSAILPTATMPVWRNRKPPPARVLAS